MQASSSSSEEPITAINITPLVDVSLVLVIIFMITMPFLIEKGMKIKSSAEKITQVSSVNEPVLVEVTEDKLIVEGRSVTAEEMEGLLKKIMDKRRIFTVAVSAKPAVTHGKIIDALDHIMASGAQDLDLLDPEEAGGGRKQRR